MEEASSVAMCCFMLSEFGCLLELQLLKDSNSALQVFSLENSEPILCEQQMWCWESGSDL